MPPPIAEPDNLTWALETPKPAITWQFRIWYRWRPVAQVGASALPTPGEIFANVRCSNHCVIIGVQQPPPLATLRKTEPCFLVVMEVVECKLATCTELLADRFSAVLAQARCDGIRHTPFPAQSTEELRVARFRLNVPISSSKERMF